MKSSSSSCSTEERARAIAYAEAECDRIQPRCREAYRATIVAKRLAEIAEENRAHSAFSARLVAAESALSRIPVPSTPVDAIVDDGWLSDLDERRAARERGLLLAKMELEQGSDAPWV